MIKTGYPKKVAINMCSKKQKMWTILGFSKFVYRGSFFLCYSF